MKLAFSTLGCPNWSFEQILTNAQAMGYQGVEIRGIQGEMRAEKLLPFLPENAADTRQQLQEHGLVLCDLGTSVHFHEPGKIEENLEEGRAAIDVCARMGIPAIRVFGDRIPEPSRRAATVADVQRGLRVLCEYAAALGVAVWLETHGDFSTTELLCEVTQGVPHPNFGLIWDIGHSYLSYGRDVTDFYQAIRPYIRHVHIKDHRPDAGYPLCLVGEGDIPIAEQVLRLAGSGYEGFFSLEWEKLWHPELPDAEIAFPGYAAFMRALGER